MTNVILAFIIAQLISTAYGLAVIGSVRPIIEQRLKDKGYVLKNKNSMYKFNENLGKFFRGLIPGYYAVKAIHDGEYITREEREAIRQREEFMKTASLSKPVEPQIIFEKPEKYVARKNGYTLYDTYEVPVEYNTYETTKEDELNITPYTGIVKEVPKVIEKEVTKSDIAKAIAELDATELQALGDKVVALAEIKQRNKSLRLKDVA